MPVNYLLTKTPVATVTSQPRPLPGESHRSSENFPIMGLLPKVTALEWEVLGDVSPDLTFDVMIDKKVASDPTVFTWPGAQDKTSPRMTSPNFYIANPCNAVEPFTIQVYSLIPTPQGGPGNPIG